MRAQASSCCREITPHPALRATFPPRGEGFMLFQEDNRMMDATKYAPGYYPVPAGYDSWVKKDHLEKAPAWCSVDLRDGNQALIVPMMHILP